MSGFVRLGAALQELPNCIGRGFLIFPEFLVKFPRNLGEVQPAPLQALSFFSQIILSRCAGPAFWHKILIEQPSITFEPLAVLPPLDGYMPQDSLVFGRESENFFRLVYPLQNLGLR